MSSHASDPLPRCRPSHQDWPGLTRCLVAQYVPPLDEAVVLDEMRRAIVAVRIGIPLEPAEQVSTAEMIVRHRLEVACGRRPDAARLDPQSHERAS
jgi:hypothetical protein